MSTTSSAPREKSARRYVLAATILGSSMAFIDGTVVNVALPALQSAFHATAVDVQWVIESYALFLAALLLVGGSLGDHFGRRLIYSTGVVLFTLASIWCGLAPNVTHLIAARAVQGIGGALLVPGSLAIITHFVSEGRARPGDRYLVRVHCDHCRSRSSHGRLAHRAYFLARRFLHQCAYRDCCSCAHVPVCSRKSRRQIREQARLARRFACDRQSWRARLRPDRILVAWLREQNGFGRACSRRRCLGSLLPCRSAKQNSDAAALAVSLDGFFRRESPHLSSLRRAVRNVLFSSAQSHPGAAIFRRQPRARRFCRSSSSCSFCRAGPVGLSRVMEVGCR